MEINFGDNHEGSKGKSSYFVHLLFLSFSTSQCWEKRIRFLCELVSMWKPEEITELFLNILKEFLRVIC